MDIKVKIGVVITDNNGKVLLIKEKLKKKPMPLWNVVKGSFDGGETVFEAARRECLEETMTRVDLVNFLGSYISEDSGSMRVQFNFLAVAENLDARIAPREEQDLRDEYIEEVRWFTKDEIIKMDPEELISSRTLELLQDWISGKSLPLDSIKQVSM